ncbi:uncharacterized protein KGF55_000420 [Candida pseudojiufengensis]|uniref:uncharacterized protein n=1 Tax=Candida pseudojiufengensis TaxID=497109 RepID=UPI0022240131|nr:uncharacterized protein KGF55_000420 [Candida pseudojiufengensis]KAI5967010.1 hypothetical protein KGF55_000420 [Candida pseudojiufengensis]
MHSPQIQNWLYLTTTILSSVFVILPISFITYNKYYNTLIPLSNSPLINLRFNELENEGMFYNLRGENNNILVSNLISTTNFENFKFDDQSPYIFKIKLNLYCSKSLQHTKCINKVDYIFNSTLRNSFILDCDPVAVYSNKNQFIPYGVKNYIPSTMINFQKSNEIELSIFEVMGNQLNSENNNLKVIEKDQNFNYNKLYLNNIENYIIDDNESFAWFEIKWTGFRYYLVKYYYLFYVIGTLIFWVIGSSTSILMGYFMLYKTIQKMEQKRQENRDKENMEFDFRYKSPIIKQEPI